MTDLPLHPPLHPGAFRDVGTVARCLSVSSETVRAWIRTGKLRAIRTPTGHFRIPASEIARILDSQAQYLLTAQATQAEQEAQKAQTARRTRRKQAQAQK